MAQKKTHAWTTYFPIDVSAVLHSAHVFAFLRYDQNTYHRGTYKCEYEQNEPTNQHNYGIVAFGDLRMAESACQGSALQRCCESVQT